MNKGFIPFTKWKPLDRITYIGYEFTINGDNIEFDERILPQQFDIKTGDTFVAKINEFGKIILEKI